ncbi:MAG: TolB protein, partial [Cellvibrionaceae bacterium]
MIRTFTLVLFICFSLNARAELIIPIVQGIDNPTVIAVTPFRNKGVSPLSEDVAKIISDNLYRSGLFKIVPPSDMLSLPSQAKDVVYRDWRLLGSEYLVIGNIQADSSRITAFFSLFDVVGQRVLLDNLIASVPANGLRDLAHYISDSVYEAITGVPGAFSTQIIYIEQPSRDRYRLIKADMDGARPQVLLTSNEPLLSPAWSPDGKSVAYVSFETRRPSIFIQNILSGSRQQLTSFSGLNGAPAWSQDGRKLALVLSKDGNPEIYTLDIATRRLTRITNHFAIDTEPAWAQNGKAIMFTSNRGGKPQIYQITLASGHVERLTFEGDYNAKPQLTPDGKGVVMVHRYDGVFHIAVQDVATGEMRILTQTSLDESPSIAPNGAILLYATKDGDRGILAGVSLDAGVKYKLPAKTGDVREPAWSP